MRFRLIPLVASALACIPTAACSSSSPGSPPDRGGDGGSGFTKDAGSSDSSHAGDGAAEGGAAIEAGGEGGCVSTPDPITGTWKMIDVTCAGAPAPAAVQAVYMAPNSLVYMFTSSANGSQVNGDLSGGSACTVTIPLAFTYPSPGNIVISDDGPITCSPAGCYPGCGTTGSMKPSYSYVETGCNQIVFTSTNQNLICSNPVAITLQRQ